MIKFAIKILVVGLVLLLGYYFFFGSPEDKERAKAVFSEVGDLFSELGSFLAEEKAKFDRGDYESELDKIRLLVEDIKAKAGGLSSLQQSADGAQAMLIGQELDSLQRLASKEDLTEEEIKELNQSLAQLKSKAEDLAESSGDSDLPKLL